MVLLSSRPSHNPQPNQLLTIIIMTEEKEERTPSGESVRKKRKYLFLDRFNMYANEIDYQMKKIWVFNYWHATVTALLTILVIYCISSR